MNIFFLYLNAVQAAQALGDKHVVKMPLEMAQLLCTAFRWLHGERPLKKKEKGNKKKVPHDDKLYKMTHYNHPMAVWVRTSMDNFIWTLEHGVSLCNEWQWRYDHPIDREHKCMRIFLLMRDFIDDGTLSVAHFPKRGFTVPPQCVGPVEKGYHVTRDIPTAEATVEAYRKYYVGEKRDIVKYDKKPERRPEWYR